MSLSVFAYYLNFLVQPIPMNLGSWKWMGGIRFGFDQVEENAPEVYRLETLVTQHQAEIKKAPRVVVSKAPMRKKVSRSLASFAEAPAAVLPKVEVQTEEAEGPQEMAAMQKMHRNLLAHLTVAVTNQDLMNIQPIEAEYSSVVVQLGEEKTARSIPKEAEKVRNPIQAESIAVQAPQLRKREAITSVSQASPEVIKKVPKKAKVEHVPAGDLLAKIVILQNELGVPSDRQKVQQEIQVDPVFKNIVTQLARMTTQDPLLDTQSKLVAMLSDSMTTQNLSSQKLDSQRNLSVPNAISMAAMNVIKPAPVDIQPVLPVTIQNAAPAKSIVQEIAAKTDSSVISNGVTRTPMETTEKEVLNSYLTSHKTFVKDLGTLIYNEEVSARYFTREFGHHPDKMYGWQSFGHQNTFVLAWTHPDENEEISFISPGKLEEEFNKAAETEGFKHGLDLSKGVVHGWISKDWRIGHVQGEELVHYISVPGKEGFDYFIFFNPQDGRTSLNLDYVPNPNYKAIISTPILHAANRQTFLTLAQDSFDPIQNHFGATIQGRVYHHSKHPEDKEMTQGIPVQLSSLTFYAAETGADGSFKISNVPLFSKYPYDLNIIFYKDEEQLVDPVVFRIKRLYGMDIDFPVIDLGSLTELKSRVDALGSELASFVSTVPGEAFSEFATDKGLLVKAYPVQNNLHRERGKKEYFKPYIASSQMDSADPDEEMINLDRSNQLGNGNTVFIPKIPKGIVKVGIGTWSGLFSAEDNVTYIIGAPHPLEKN